MLHGSFKMEHRNLRVLLIRFSASIVCFALSIAVLEVCARAFYDRLTTARGRKFVELLLGEVQLDDALRIQRHPYMLYINRPGWEDDGIRQHNSYGHRGPEITPLPQPGTKRILALGGSTTYGYLLKRFQSSWPAQLGPILSERLDFHVEVINAGLPFALSSELLSHYLYRDRHLGASIVIIHEGGNDSVPLLLEEYSPDYGFFRGWTTPPFGRRAGEGYLLRLRLMRIIYGWWLVRSDMGIDSFIAQPHSVEQLPLAKAIENVTKNEPVGFERNIDALIKMVLADKATPVLFPFYLAEPEVFRTVEPGLDAGKRLYDAVAIGWKKNVDVMERLARRHNVPFIRIPPETIPLKYFFDHCHLRKEGETIKANFVADKIEGLVH